MKTHTKKPYWIARQCLASILENELNNETWLTGDPNDEVSDEELNAAILYTISMLKEEI